MKEGRIVKALSGFYYVYSDRKIYACKGRGVFRNRKITPLVGDFVTFDLTNNQEGYITNIKERTNELVRPPIANVTQAILVNSIVEPTFSKQLLDRFIVIAESKNIKPMIVLTKKDLASEKELDLVRAAKQLYEQLGYSVQFFSMLAKEKPIEIIGFLRNEVTVLMGQSGVGKSTILNTIDPRFAIETAAISKSLGRGRHTTRHVELHRVNDGLVADTPGFSSIDFAEINADELKDYFIEINEHGKSCKFRSCLHVKEPQCAVKKAVEQGNISTSRYENYLLFLEEILSRKPRY